MKVPFPPLYIPYGPAGHPDAQFFTRFMGMSKEDVECEFYRWIEKNQSQGEGPTMFYNSYKNFEEQGYYILHMVDGEVDDQTVAGLPSVRMFSAVKEGKPGRKVEEWKNDLPSFINLDSEEVWEEGNPECDHDIGLESYTAALLTESGKMYPEPEFYNVGEKGQFYVTLTCTRCGRQHAYPEEE